MVAIPISAEAAPWLAALAARYNIATLRLDQRSLDEVEATLRSKIPWDVIALVAIEGRSLRDLVELTGEIRTFYATTDPAAAKQLGFRHVAFAELPTDPSEPAYAAFARTDTRDPGAIVEWILFKPSPGAHPYSIERYVREVRQVDRSQARSQAPPPTVELVAPIVADEYVVHAKFGRGRVTARRDGKVTVEFADATRTLAAGFVKPA